MAHAGGRPTDYTQDLADSICEELSAGVSLRTVCSVDGMPSAKSVFRWLRIYPEFRQQYTIAKEESTDALAEEIIDISDDGTNDYMTITKGNHSYNVEDREVTNRSRLRVDTRKWIMSKMKPKKYGDKLDMTTNGKDLPTPLLSVIKTNNAILNNDGNKEAGTDEETP